MVTGAEDGHVALEGPDGSERRFRPSGNASTYLGLYDTERIEVRAGEHIRWTRNRKARPEYSTTMHFGRGSTRRASATAGTCSPTGTRSSRNWRRPQRKAAQRAAVLAPFKPVGLHLLHQRKDHRKLSIVTARCGIGVPLIVALP